VTDAKGLFMRLQEKGLLENYGFLCQLLQTIGRNDLVNNFLRTGYSQCTEADANPMLSHYRVMLYQIYEDITKENLEKMKFLLEDKLGKGQAEKCNTALDVFAEMEKKGLLSNTNLNELLNVLHEVDVEIAQSKCHRALKYLLIKIFVTTEYYLFTHDPRGLCLVINNETFYGNLKNRAGSHEDARALYETFTSLGFLVDIHKDLSSVQMTDLLRSTGMRNFYNDDALVVCVLSHGEYGCVYGTDEKTVSLRELTQPFNSHQAPSLAGKPKLFFIQACQGNRYQTGSLPSIQKSEDVKEPKGLEADAGPVQGETVPSDADFLLGMSTVPECKSFRSTTTGSIYIQELCKQINTSAK
ncbi:hypothetical protein NL108_008636, partial [Boleophthalmus pectinirostris]